MAGQLVHDYSSRTKLTLDAQRAFLDDSAVHNATYTDTRVRFGFQHFITYKIAALGFVSYRSDDYDRYEIEPVTGALKKRSDEAWSFGVGGLYNVQKWLQARIEYEYTNNDSNFLTYSYNEHRVFLRLVFSR
jgi:hypothetical protein